MQLEGLHHITAITGNAPANVDFYVRVLGLRLVKKTVNQDDPTVYHLFYADEQASAGADLTFFEYPSARPGRPGAGMVHRIGHRVGSDATLEFWEQRLQGEGVRTRTEDGQLIFSDPEGLQHALLVSDAGDPPLVARSNQVPDEHALQGFDHVRAFSTDLDGSADLLTATLGFTRTGENRRFESRGSRRGGEIVYDDAPGAGAGGAGTIHHVAWASELGEIEAWQQRVAQSRLAHPTPVIDRFYFRSVYFREPSGVLFELATLGPGFAVDEDASTLGEALSLPPNFEELRDRLGGVLTPLPDVRQWRPTPSPD